MGYRTVVAGIDGSQTSLRALETAAQLAAAQGSDLVILDVTEPGVDAMVPQAALDRALAVARKHDANARVRQEAGDPADTIIRVAEDEKADLIVLGNRGMSGVQRFMLGNVPNKVSHHAPCDVMIVRTT